MWPFSKRQTEVTDKNATHLLNEIKNKHPQILDSVISEMGKKNKHWKIPTFREIKPYEPPKGVIPENRNARIAQDREAINIAFGADYSSMSTTNFSEYGYGGFPGYPYLSQLAQISEYRNATQIYAEEMTRKFIELKYKDNNPNIAKLQQLNAAIERFKVCEVFRKAAIHDGYFGRGQIYIDLKTPQKKLAWLDQEELNSKLVLDPAKITKNSLVGFRNIEPIWTYPGVYNADNPLSDDWYKPTEWYVMGRTVHDSRMLCLILNPLPDILKPAYNFGGISRSQLIEIYIQNWLRTRDSISDIIHSFVLYGLKTNMEDALSGLTQPLWQRAELFNRTKDNRGMIMLDAEKEDFFQFQTSLTGLSDLQAQALEQICTTTRIPLVKFTGVTLSGLNASSDGEIRVFYDTVKAFQESLFRDPLEIAIDIIQLNEFGFIDPNITFDFIPLYEMNEEQLAKLRLDNAKSDALYAKSGVFTPSQIYSKVTTESDSIYHTLQDDDNEEENEIE